MKELEDQFIRHYLPDPKDSTVSAYWCSANDDGTRFVVDNRNGSHTSEAEELAESTRKHFDSKPNAFFPFGKDERKHIWYLVTGKIVGRGRDGEPKLESMQRLKTLIFDGKHFRPSTGPERESLKALYREFYQEGEAEE